MDWRACSAVKAALVSSSTEGLREGEAGEWEVSEGGPDEGEGNGEEAPTKCTRKIANASWSLKNSLNQFTSKPLPPVSTAPISVSSTFTESVGSVFTEAERERESNALQPATMSKTFLPNPLSLTGTLPSPSASFVMAERPRDSDGCRRARETCGLKEAVRRWARCDSSRAEERMNVDRRAGV